MPDTTTITAPAPANSGGATATVEAPAVSTPPSTPSGGQTHPDRAAFDNAMAKATSQRSDKADTVPPQQAAAEIDPRQEAIGGEAEKEGQQPEPLKVDLTDRAKKYVTELEITPDKALDAAIAAFDRDGIFDEDELQKMLDESPAKFIERGLKRARVQRDGDNFTAKHHQTLEELKALKQGATAGATAPNAEPVPIADAVKKTMDEVLAGLPEGDYVEGKDLRDVMGIGLTTVVEKVAAHHQQQMTALQQQYEAKTAEYEQRQADYHNQILDLQLSQARTRLAAKYASIAEPQRFESVLKHYYALAAAASATDTVDTVMDRAAAAEFGDESQTAIRDRLLRNHATRKAVQPRLPSPLQSKQAVPMTDEDKNRLAYSKAMEKGYGKSWNS